MPVKHLTFDAIQSDPRLLELVLKRARRARARGVRATIVSVARRLLRRRSAERWPAAGAARLVPPAGTATIAIRAAGNADRDGIQALVRGLSTRSRYLRFFNGMRELSPQWLDRFTRAASPGDGTLIALAQIGDRETPVGMAQYAASPHHGRSEFAVAVADEWQRTGIGTRLIRHIGCLVRESGATLLECEVLAENQPMLRLARRLGFGIERDGENPISLRASLSLSVSHWPCSELPQRVAVVRGMQA
jgi:RimJ/RimL family protein N-acetyltransferase